MTQAQFRVILCGLATEIAKLSEGTLFQKNIMTEVSPISCKEAFERAHLLTVTPKATGERIPIGEVYTIDDYEFIDFKGYNNKSRLPKEINKWSQETSNLAKKSLTFYGLELVFKTISYFFKQLDEGETFTKRFYFSLEKLFGTLAGMFRNQIYGREDDNLGAEKKAKEVFGDVTTARLSLINNFIQTKGRFLIPILGVFNPTLANDLDWGIVNALDSAWWRNMSLNSAFYPGFIQDIITKTKSFVFKSNESHSIENLPTLKYIMSKLKTHWQNSRALINLNKSSKASQENKSNKYLLQYFKSMDQLTSIIMPIICLPSNLLGDTFRPIARRLGLTGLPRNITRILSVLDRSILGINYYFRFYKAEQHLENKFNVPNKLRSSYLYLGSLIGDLVDLPLTIFEDKIKESNKWLQHSAEVMRILKDSAFNAFWAAKRVKRWQTFDRGDGDDRKTKISPHPPLLEINNIPDNVIPTQPYREAVPVGCDN